MQCQGPAKPDVKINSKKFQPWPELGHQAPQEQGDGEGSHVGEPGGHGSLTFLEFFEGPNLEMRDEREMGMAHFFSFLDIST